MRVAVISPHANSTGSTTLSMLIALELSKNGKKTCITHSNPMSNVFQTYLNFVGYIDKTSTPSQIVKILREGTIQKDDVSDYCKQIADDLEAFTNNATNFDKNDMDFMIQYIAKEFPHEHVVFDVDDKDVERAKMVIQLCDVVVLNITQSASELNRFKNMRDTAQKMIGDKPIVVVVNKYNSIKGTLKEAASMMGIKKPNNWVVLHENPWIAWATNHGQLNVLYRKIKEKDIRVIELNSELAKIVKTLMQAKASYDKKNGGKRR